MEPGEWYHLLLLYDVLIACLGGMRGTPKETFVWFMMMLSSPALDLDNCKKQTNYWIQITYFEMKQVAVVQFQVLGIPGTFQSNILLRYPVSRKFPSSIRFRFYSKSALVALICTRKGQRVHS